RRSCGTHRRLRVPDTTVPACTALPDLVHPVLALGQSPPRRAPTDLTRPDTALVVPGVERLRLPVRCVCLVARPWRTSLLLLCTQLPHADAMPVPVLWS